MPFCEMCGNELKPEHKFCAACGAPVAACGSAAAGGSGAADAQAGADGLVDADGQAAASVATAGSEATEDLGGGVAAGAFAPEMPPSDASGAAPDQPLMVDEEAAQDASKKKKAIIIGAVALAVVACAVAFFVVSGLTGGGLSPTSAVTFSATDAVKARPSTRIVMYGEDGEPLSGYDLTVLDEDGGLETYSVDGDSFVPEELGIPEGTYSFMVEDPDTGESYTAPDVEIDEGADAGTGEDVGIAPPSDPGEGNTGNQKTDREVAYMKFLKKVKEYQSTYGEAEVKINDDGYLNYMTGLCFAKLVDFEKDDIEELVVAYNSSSSGYEADGYVVEVWAYDADKKDIECVSKPMYPQAGEANYLSILLFESDGKWYLNGSSSDSDAPDFVVTSKDASIDYEEMYFGVGDSGEFKTWYLQEAHESSTDSETINYYVDRSEVGKETYEAALSRFSGSGWHGSYCLVAQSTTYGGVGDADSPSEVLQETEETIEALEAGARGAELDDGTSTDSNSPSDEPESNSSEDVSAQATAAYEELLKEYRNALDEVNGATSSSTSISESEYPHAAEVINSYFIDGRQSSFDADAWGFCYRDLNSDGISELAITSDVNDSSWVSLYTYDSSDGLVDLLSERKSNWYYNSGNFVEGNSSLVRLNSSSGEGHSINRSACKLDSDELESVESYEINVISGQATATHTKTDGTTESEEVSNNSSTFPYEEDFEAAYPIEEDVSWTDIQASANTE